MSERIQLYIICFLGACAFGLVFAVAYGAVMGNPIDVASSQLATSITSGLAGYLAKGMASAPAPAPPAVTPPAPPPKTEPPKNP